MWKQDKKTKEWQEYEWICEDTGENPFKMGYPIEQTGKKQVAIDKKGIRHNVVMVNLSTGEYCEPMNIF